MPDIIKTTNLNKHFGKTQALYDLTIAVAENSITGLIGSDGSGKTTLMKILAGQLGKTSGEALVFGECPMDNLPILNKIIYASHDMEHNPELKLKTILGTFKIMFPNFDSDLANTLLKQFELNEKIKYRKLPEGTESIFNFLCALSCRAPLTMLDQPVLEMDVSIRKSAYEALLLDFKEHPRTFIISSQSLSDIEETLTDALLIDQGKCILNCPIDDARLSAHRMDENAQALDSKEGEIERV